MANIVYLTKQGLEKLNSELTSLKEEKRVEIAEKLKEAISFGDLSENSEYEEARNEQAQVEVRISELTEQLKNVEIIKESSKTNSNKVNMGSSITIMNTSDKTESTYKIVGQTESDILAKDVKISNDSPIGKALIGRKKGDIVNFKAPAGDFEYKILNIA